MNIDSNFIWSLYNKLSGDNKLPNEEVIDLIDTLIENLDIINTIGKEVFEEMLQVLQKDDESRVRYYDMIVAKMSWEERLELMQKSSVELRASASQNVKWAALFVELSKISIKLLPLILMIL